MRQGTVFITFSRSQASAFSLCFRETACRSENVVVPGEDDVVARGKRSETRTLSRRDTSTSARKNRVKPLLLLESYLPFAVLRLRQQSISLYRVRLAALRAHVAVHVRVDGRALAA